MLAREERQEAAASPKETPESPRLFSRGTVGAAACGGPLGHDAVCARPGLRRQMAGLALLLLRKMSYSTFIYLIVVAAAACERPVEGREATLSPKPSRTSSSAYWSIRTTPSTTAILPRQARLLSPCHTSSTLPTRNTHTFLFAAVARPFPSVSSATSPSTVRNMLPYTPIAMAGVLCVSRLQCW